MAMTPEERIQIVIDWFNRNPKAADDVQKKLDKLMETYERAKIQLVDYSKSMEAQKGIYDALKPQYADSLEKIAKTNDAFKMISGAMKQQQKQLDDNKKKWNELGNTLTKAGRIVGFYGFITSFSIQRILRTLGQVQSFFTTTISATSKWVDQLVDTAVSMAYLRKEGLLTADMQATLSASMARLRSEGPKVEALWMGLNSVWASVQATLATALIPALTQLLQTAAQILAQKSMQDMLQNMAVAFGRVALAVLPAIPSIVGFITVVAQLAEVLRPLYPIIMPVALLMMVLGTVCTIIGPLLSTLGYIITALVKVHGVWGAATTLQTMRMYGLAMSLLQVGLIAGSLIATLWMFARISSAATRDLENDYNKMTKGITAGTIEIVDAQGNVIYTIDTLTNEVKNAKGEIVGHYDSMTNIIYDDSGKIIGYYDAVSKKFKGIAGEMAGELGVGKVIGALDDLQDSINSLDFKNLTGSLGDLNTSVGNVNDTMVLMQGIMATMAAVEIVVLIAKIASLIGIGGGGFFGLYAAVVAAETGVVPLTASFGQMLAVLGPLAIVLGGFAAAAYLLREAFKSGLLPSLNLLERLDDLIFGADRASKSFEDLQKKLFNMCFKHAAPAASAFNDVLGETIGKTEDTTNSVTALASILRKVQVPAIEIPEIPTKTLVQEIQTKVSEIPEIKPIEIPKIELPDLPALVEKISFELGAFPKIPELAPLIQQIKYQIDTLPEIKIPEIILPELLKIEPVEVLVTETGIEGVISKIENLTNELIKYRVTMLEVITTSGELFNREILPNIPTIPTTVTEVTQVIESSGPVTQYFTVYVTINIATLAATADLDKLVEAVSKGIAEGTRRRGK